MDTGRSKAVVLMSGGMDSCLTAAIAAQNHELAALHVSYGQLTESRERQAFRDIADFYKIRERLIVEQPYLGKIGGSALTDARIPLRETNLSAPLGAGFEADGIRSSSVPSAKANFPAVGSSWGGVLGALRRLGVLLSRGGRHVSSRDLNDAGRL